MTIADGNQADVAACREVSLSTRSAIRFAEEQSIDLIVAATHGMQSWSRLCLLNSRSKT
jgi:nucleotide-binding universal stress UspA family protein